MCRQGGQWSYVEDSYKTVHKIWFYKYLKRKFEMYFVKSKTIQRTYSSKGLYAHIYPVWVFQEESWEHGNPSMESERLGSCSLCWYLPGPTGAHAAVLSRASSPEESALAEVICSWWPAFSNWTQEKSRHQPAMGGEQVLWPCLGETAAFVSLALCCSFLKSSWLEPTCYSD